MLWGMCPPPSEPMIRTSSVDSFRGGWLRQAQRNRLRKEPVPVSAETVERRVQESGQGLKVVAALEHRSHPRSEPRTASGELAEAGAGDLHPRQRIVHVRGG